MSHNHVRFCFQPCPGSNSTALRIRPSYSADGMRNIAVVGSAKCGQSMCAKCVSRTSLRCYGDTPGDIHSPTLTSSARKMSFNTVSDCSILRVTMSLTASISLRLIFVNIVEQSTTRGLDATTFINMSARRCCSGCFIARAR
jgi:hypothetical protein